MSGETINDYSARGAYDLPDRPQVSADAPETPAAGADARRRKPRTRKPRPCFDDGALTRVFKFPSKTYPRSSYYVTGDEIIIRIKKARKRWKMVVPKKRLVSYRTNRWFAKPRWVEIELTYTQAVRLGLVEPRPAFGQVNGDVQAISAGVGEAFAVSDAGPAAMDAAAKLQGSVEDEAGETSVDLGDFDIEQDLAPEADDAAEDVENSEAEPVAGSEAVPEPVWAWRPDETFVPEIDQSDEAARNLETVFDAQDSGPDLLAAPLLTPDDAATISTPFEIRLPDTPAAIAADRVSNEQPPDETAAIRPARVAKVERGAYAPLLAAGLALVLVGGAGSLLWRGGDHDGEPVAVARNGACPGGADARECGQDFVTGSISSVLERPAVEVIDSVVPAEGSPWARELDTPPVPSQQAADAGEPLSVDATGAKSEPEPSTAAMVEARPEPSEATAAMSASCQQAEAAARSFRVQFQYASDRIEPAVVLELIGLADRLKACPSLKVTMEGHTDSDGHPDRNQGLSRRRAETVLAVLAQSGLTAERMSAIGFGQERPLVENDTVENRRRNRRVEFSISHGR